MKHCTSIKNPESVIPLRSCRHAVILALALISILPPLRAQDDKPVDVNSVLKTLLTIKTTQETSTKATELQLATQFLTKAGSVSDATLYYKEAIRATKLEGKSTNGIDYQEWEAASAVRFKTKSFRDALMFHLTYLSLTLRHSAKVDMKILLPDLVNYTQQVMADMDDLIAHPDVVPGAPGGGGGGGKRDGGGGGQRGNGNANAIVNGHAAPAPLDPEFMGQPLTSSVFVKWLHIESYVSGQDDWESVPGDVDGIYDKTILPEFRKNMDPRLLQYWDQRIQREGDIATKTKLNFTVEQFNQITRPKLLWNRAQELLALKQKNRGINEMLTIIKSYPTHPDSTNWISQLQQIVSPPATSPAPAAAAPASQPPLTAVP